MRNSDLARGCITPKPSPGSEAAGSGASSARKNVQWTFFSKMGPAGPRLVDFLEDACIVPGKTEEVVLPRKTMQTVDTAGGPTSSGASRHLPLNRSLRSLGKAFGSRQPPFLFPVPCSLVSPTNQNFPSLSRRFRDNVMLSSRLCDIPVV